MRLRPSTGAFSLPRTVSGGAGNAKGVIMQPEQTHPRPRGFRRRLLGDIFHGVKRYLILGVAATLCATFLTYVTPLVVSFTVDSVIGDKTPELPAALSALFQRMGGRAYFSSHGESFGNYKLGMDDKILEIVTSANIACGFHAGDPSVMQKTVALAVKNGAALGAHPGYPDLVGFGRRKMDIAPSDVYNMVVYQVGALAAFAKAAGTRLQHVKPHGAMYNMAAKNAKLAEAIAQAVYDVDKDLILYAQGGTESIKAAEKIGLRTASEVFADRSYQDDGTLTPRSQPGAMITDEEKSIAQVLSMVLEGKVTALSGKVIPVKADSICLHGDGPKALVFANKIRSVLLENGVKVAASGTFIK